VIAVLGVASALVLGTPQAAARRQVTVDDSGFQTYRLGKQLDAMAEGMKLYEAGVRYTKEEADARSVAIKLEGGGSEQLVFTTEEMEQRKWAWVYGELERQGQQKERVKVVARIDSYLAGSPMAGLGEAIVTRCEAYSINPYLVPAIAEAESSRGMACFASHNAWGMIGAGGFDSFESAIDYWCEMVNTHWPGVQNAYQMAGYCVPDFPWCDSVNGVAKAIEAIEI